ncbi:probable arabinosyltransferase ARAD1 isoform X1 [Amborella trichopoda]|uniref:Exostosin GT47 domain-containing protein n=1 Tax=Amborella trichopoda TaxID=13333 RepID=W1NQZ5_AMBTC|nr:probable arabinosyltransferase ARAD1 isoform X1 [Amborella trichopoda]ERM98212.1 hypothetical protein AMTR_s00095p00145390 [Amborella trichopoda]|eukprot:XP_006832934.3 probable arabinosyltransferase ARAD1 isoform X1 [Amborella trichopoda]
MAGKHSGNGNPRIPTGKSTTAILFLSTLSLLFISFFFFFSSPQAQNFNLSPPIRSLKAEHSFVVSLDRFLKTRSYLLQSENSDQIQATGSFSDDELSEEAKKLDFAMWKNEKRAFEKGFVGAVPIRVYIYDMPAKYTYDLLRLFLNTYRETSNLTSNGSPVHRLIEQHSVDYWLWADLIAPESERHLKHVVRVHNQEDADLFYIPFFTTISFFLLEKQQCKQLYREVLKWVKDQPAWQRSEGRDHILPVHHPWSFKSVRRFMKNAIWLLPDMDSTGNWYKPGEVWLEKDLILPYVPNVEVCDGQCLQKSEHHRKTLLFFRGRLKRNAGGKIRWKLVEELRGAEGVVIEEGTAGDKGKAAAQDGMRRSIFCLSPAGDTPSSARLFDAIVSGCIPVIVSDELELPFEGLLDYRKIALFVSSDDAVKPGWLLAFLKSVESSKIKEMRENLGRHSKHFLYSSPAQLLGPEDFTWRMIAGKVVNIKMHIRRSQRMVKNSRALCTCECQTVNITTNL